MAAPPLTKFQKAILRASGALFFSIVFAYLAWTRSGSRDSFINVVLKILCFIFVVMAVIAAAALFVTVQHKLQADKRRSGAAPKEKPQAPKPGGPKPVAKSPAGSASQPDFSNLLGDDRQPGDTTIASDTQGDSAPVKKKPRPVAKKPAQAAADESESGPFEEGDSPAGDSADPETAGGGDFDFLHNDPPTKQ